MQISNKARLVSTSLTLAIDAKFKKMKENGEDVCGFGAGEPDFDTPQYIKQAAIDAINEGFTKYTVSSGMIELRQAICSKLFKDNQLSYTPSQIVVSNGAKHSLLNTFLGICEPGDEVIIVAPYWVSYPELIKMADGVPVILNTKSSFKIDANRLIDLITPKTKAIIINSPNNPTGIVYTQKELEQIADIAVNKNIYVVSDEIYEKIVYSPSKHISIASLSDDIKQRTIVVNGLSKTYAMTGWRIGYTACCEQLAKAMGNIQSHATSNPNSIAQKAAIVALGGGSEEINFMIKEFETRKNYMFDRISKSRWLCCNNPNGAFYMFVDISSIMGKIIDDVQINSAYQFAELLLDKVKVAVVPGEGFGVNNYIRLSYATSMNTISKGLDRIEEFLDKKLKA